MQVFSDLERSVCRMVHRQVGVLFISNSNGLNISSSQVSTFLFPIQLVFVMVILYISIYVFSDAKPTYKIKRYLNNQNDSFDEGFSFSQATIVRHLMLLELNSGEIMSRACANWQAIGIGIIV